VRITILSFRARGALGHHREVRAQGARGEEHLVGCVGEALEKQLLGVGRQRADPCRVPDQPAGEPATQRAAREREYLRAVESEDEALRAERLEELEQHHGQHRPRLGKVDRRISQLAPGRNQLPGEPDLAGEVVGALERQPAYSEGPFLLYVGGGGLRPDLDVIPRPAEALAISSTNVAIPPLTG